MNSEFEPISGNLPPQEPGKVNELIYPVAGEEVDGDKWTPNQQPPVDTSLPETNVSPQLEQEIADVTNEIARGLVIEDSNNQQPLKTEMPDGIISESQNNIPNGTDTIGGFGELEKRSFEESIKQEKKGEPGWIGTAYVNPEAMQSNAAPQTAAAPPPPPPSPPEGPSNDQPPYTDNNKMPPGAYDKAPQSDPEAFIEKYGDDNQK
jgi:hypothetical protein